MSNQLDFILANGEVLQSGVVNDAWNLSDHRYLFAKVQMEEHKRIYPIRGIAKVVLRNDLSIDELKMIINNEDWPQYPFIEIAKKLGFTKEITSRFNPVGQLSRLVAKTWGK